MIHGAGILEAHFARHRDKGLAEPNEKVEPESKIYGFDPKNCGTGAGGQLPRHDLSVAKALHSVWRASRLDSPVWLARRNDDCARITSSQLYPEFRVAD